MPGAISNPSGGVIPAAGVQNNLNPSNTVAPSANAVLNALAQKASNQALQGVAQTASEAAQAATDAAQLAAAAPTDSEVDQKISAAIEGLPTTAPGPVETPFPLDFKFSYDKDYRTVVDVYAQTGPIAFTRNEVGAIRNGSMELAILSNGSAIDLSGLRTAGADILGESLSTTEAGATYSIQGFRKYGKYSTGVFKIDQAVSPEFAPPGPASLVLPNGTTSLAALLPNLIPALRASHQTHTVGLFLGDSTTAGYSGVAAPSYVDARPYTPVEKFMDTLASYGFKVNRQNFMGEQNAAATGVTPQQYDSRITLGAGWDTTLIGAGTLGGRGFTAPGGNPAGALSFACTAPVDRCVVFFATALSANGATCTVDNGGAVLATFNCDQAEALRQTAPIDLGSLANHTINIRVPSSGGTGFPYIVGLMCWNAADPGVTVLNCGWGGAKAADFASTAQGYNIVPSLPSIGHDFALVSLLINDWRAGTSTSSFSTDTAAIVDAAKASGSADVILFQGPRSSNADRSTALQDAYIAEYNALVNSKTVPLINVTTDLGENTGLPNYVDGIGHLSRDGNVKLGTDLSLRLLNAYTP